MGSESGAVEVTHVWWAWVGKKVRFHITAVDAAVDDHGAFERQPGIARQADVAIDRSAIRAKRHDRMIIDNHVTVDHRILNIGVAESEHPNRPVDDVMPGGLNEHPSALDVEGGGLCRDRVVTTETSGSVSPYGQSSILSRCRERIALKAHRTALSDEHLEEDVFHDAVVHKLNI